MGTTTASTSRRWAYHQCLHCLAIYPARGMTRDKYRPGGFRKICRRCEAYRTAVARRRDQAAALLKSAQCSRSGKALGVAIDKKWIEQRLENLERCELTGWRLNKGPRKPGGHGANPFAPSLDRIDNSVGYVPSNIRIVCAFGNSLMHTYSDEDMEPVVAALREAIN